MNPKGYIRLSAFGKGKRSSSSASGHIPVIPGSVYRCKKTERKDKTVDLFRIILAVIFPPLGVFTQVGFGFHFWLNIPLTLLGFLPGVIHAVYIIAKRD